MFDDIQHATAALTPAGDAPQSQPCFCPWCGHQTLKPTAGAGFVKKGCWSGRHYCYEGDLPGFACADCNHVFTVDLDDDEIHADCECQTSPDCECGRYDAASERDAAAALP